LGLDLGEIPPGPTLLWLRLTNLLLADLPLRDFCRSQRVILLLLRKAF
jgi:hypothetical protein